MSSNAPTSAKNDDARLGEVTSCQLCTARYISMCSVLNDHELKALKSITDHVEIAPNTIICEEGEKSEYLFNVVTGCLTISKMLADGRRQIIAFLCAGDFFGLSGSEGYGYSVESVTNAHLCRMPNEKLIPKFNEFPKLGLKLFDLTKTELLEAQNHMLLLGRKKAKEKLCSFLLDMAKKSTLVDNVPKGSIYLPMRRSDIADFLGLTIETVSRQFTILVNDNILSLEDNIHIKILNRGQMEIIASGE